MPSTVAQLFAVAGLAPEGVVRWGSPVSEQATGVYVVSLVRDTDSTAGAVSAAPVGAARVAHLLKVRPELCLDRLRPSADQLIARLSAFWLPDEVVLYVGLAGQPLRTRVRQYYRTPLGARQPHAGGWWLKTLSVLEELWVHYAPTPEYENAETAMLSTFAEAASRSSCRALFDPERVAPFANLRTGAGPVKAHGINAATGDLSVGSAPRRLSSAKPGAGGSAVAQRRPSPRTAAATAGGRAASQRVTARDLVAGQVRFPRAAKRLFPQSRAPVDVIVRGRHLQARWDPRVGLDRERSGVLAFGRGRLDGVIAADEVLDIKLDATGRLTLD